MQRVLETALCALLLAACSSDSSGLAPRNVGPGADGTAGDGTGDGSSEPSDATGGNDGTNAGDDGNGAAPNGDAGQGAGDGAGDGDRVRFVVLGDGGTGDASQKKVAAVVKSVCAQRGCDLALYLGDNIYETGATSVDDEQFRTKFEEPYAELDFPFYVALGNHDYTSGPIAGSGFDANKADFQVEYTARSNKWNMPDHYYTLRVGPVAFFALDTNAIVHDEMWTAEEQQAWLSAEVAKSDAPWKVVFGHHPYVSNGFHGNAGNYDGLGLIPSILNPNGDTLAALVEASVCGKAQVYFSGHDHNREWLEPTCGTSFIVSGAAAKLRDLANRDNPASRWKDATKRGFLWAEVQGDTMTGVFYDDAGNIDYMDTITR